MIEIKNSCVDIPSIFDYKSEDIKLGGNKKNKKVVFPKNELIVWDQSEHDDTKMSCTRQGMNHISNAQNLLEYTNYGRKYDQRDPRPIRLRYTSIYPNAIKQGASLQSSLKQFKNEGLISGYATVRNLDAVKSYIDKGNYIFTGSNNGDWRYVIKNKKYRLRTDGKIIGHAFCIVGYNNENQTLIALNSYGETSNYFEIPYELLNTLFTRYVVYDMTDAEALKEYKIKKDKETLEKVIELGLYNGDRPNDFITREECALMVGRMYEKVLKLLEK